MSISNPEGRNKFGRAFFTWLNKVVLGAHFEGLEFYGLEHIPTDGPFLALANHQSRFDGLLLFKAIDRVANYMVSPNELKGFQGSVIKSLGGFPADPRFNLMSHMQECIGRGEGIAIFPEGNVFRDGIMHPFKKGAARLVLMCHEKAINLPILPIGISYRNNMARLAVARPVSTSEAVTLGQRKQIGLIEAITEQLQEHVKMVRDVLEQPELGPGVRTFNLVNQPGRRCEIA